MLDKLFQGGVVTVAASGTAVQLSSSSIFAHSVVFQGDPSNTDLVYIGDSDVDATSGLALGAEDIYSLGGQNRARGGDSNYDLSDIWVDAAVGGEKLRYFYVKART